MKKNLIKLRVKSSDMADMLQAYSRKISTEPDIYRYWFRSLERDYSKCLIIAVWLCELLLKNGQETLGLTTGVGSRYELRYEKGKAYLELRSTDKEHLIQFDGTEQIDIELEDDTIYNYSKISFRSRNELYKAVSGRSNG